MLISFFFIQNKSKFAFLKVFTNCAAKFGKSINMSTFTLRIAPIELHEELVSWRMFIIVSVNDLTLFFLSSVGTEH